MIQTTGHWMTDAEYIYWDEKDWWVFGEDDRANWWVPVRRGEKLRWRLFNRHSLLDWLRYWNSRRRNQVVFLHE
jgi:hypothetical protein